MSNKKGYYEELLQKYLKGECTPAEIAALFAWLRSSEAHRPLLASLQQEFNKVMQEPHEVPAAISDRIEARLLQDISRNKIVPLRNRWRWIAAAAVTVLALAGGGYWLYSTENKPAGLADNTIHYSTYRNDVAPGTNKAVLTLADGTTVELDSAGHQVLKQGQTLVQQHNGRLEYAAQGKEQPIGFNTLVVPRGGQFNVVLPDGTRVWINAASRLKYPTAFTGDKRTVELEGQAYFEVAQQANRPFIVSTAHADVTALGTSFDIMAYPDEQGLSATLVDGSVRVQRGSRQEVLKPGQRAVVEYTTGDLFVQVADVQEAIAWKTGFFEFDNVSMRLIMRQLARWYDLDVSYGENMKSTRLFGGRISRNLPLSEILHMLEANGAQFVLDERRLKVTAE